MSEPTPNAGPIASHKGASGFLMNETAGVPNWAWVLVVAAGVVLAVIVPRVFGNSKSASTATGSGTANDPLNSGNGSSGIGLAIDPTTGLPYAVSGLVPSGGSAGSSGPDLSTLYAQLGGLQTQQTADEKAASDNQSALQTTLNAIRKSITDITSGLQNTGGANQGGPVLQPTPVPVPQPIPQPTQAPVRYVTVTKWPSLYGTLSGIASQNGLSLQRIEQLNPNISNPNLIYPGQQVRVA